MSDEQLYSHNSPSFIWLYYQWERYAKFNAATWICDEMFYF